MLTGATGLSGAGLVGAGLVGAGLGGAGFGRGAPCACVAVAGAAPASEVGSGVTLDVEAGAGSGALTSAIVGAAGAPSVAAGLTVGPDPWLQALAPKRPSPESPSAPRPSAATRALAGLEIGPINLIELLDAPPVFPGLAPGAGAKGGAATVALGASIVGEAANEGAETRGSGHMPNNVASLGAGAIGSAVRVAVRDPVAH